MASKDAARDTFVRNVRALFAVQLLTYLLPLALVPFLTRKLGLESYGVVAAGIAFSQVLSVIVDFGFNLSATYSVATSQQQSKSVSQLYSSVAASKALIFLAVLAALLPLFLTGVVPQQHKAFFLAMILPVALQVMQPMWLLHGLQRAGAVAMYTLISRGTFCASVLLLVRGPDDTLVVAGSNALGHLLAAVAATQTARRLGYVLAWPTWRAVTDECRSAFPFFLSRVAVMMYTSGATLILAVASGPAEVARYAVAEQLFRGAQSLFASVPQALFPNMARDRDYEMFRKVLVMAVVGGAAGLVLGVLVGEELLSLIFGSEYVASFPVLVVFIATLSVVMPSTLLGYPLMGALGKLRVANNSVLLGGAIQAASFLVLLACGQMSALSVAVSILATEIIVLTYRIWHASRNSVWRLKVV